MIITEIINRSEQGATRPFLCRGDDDLLYYVKGRYAGCRATCCEWVAGRLGVLLGLPIPNFQIAEVPRDIVSASTRSDAGDLGEGLVFASQLVEDAQEITYSDLKRIDTVLQRKVLLFDWWVRNQDRSLTQLGGNPNLLLTTTDSILWVFDLNLAFDDTFDEACFWRSHAFNGSIPVWPEDFINEMTERMTTVITELPNIWRELPEVWLYPLSTGNSTEIFEYAKVKQTLERFKHSPEEFWTIRRQVT